MMVSDRPGSVYLLTAFGLAHYTSAAPAYDHYEARGVYPVTEICGQVRGLVCGPPGYVAAATFTESTHPCRNQAES